MLVLVPTPVGNLEDITMRALRVLREAAVVACEDTRTTGVLLNHYGITTPRTSFHVHNEHGKAASLVGRMLAGETVALCSDAGTPGISDPGFLLVRAAVEAGVRVEALPGPTAFVPALVASGLPCDRFVYEGFLPHKKGRQTRLKAIAAEPRTVVLYESPHRLARLLGELVEHCGAERPASVAREISKTFEENRRGTLAELAAHYGAQEKVRGEIAVVIGGSDEKAPREKATRNRAE
ncbi:MAG TPA: 16S rRNA (cytidine(1402)-2'-O)-methyltransferase [Rubricoccaceae bacterium]